MSTMSKEVLRKMITEGNLKTAKTQFGQLPIDAPRDRNGDFEPVVVPKNKRDIR